MLGLHLGAGNFGLGFVVPYLTELCDRTVILNRQSIGEVNKKFSILRERKSYSINYNNVGIKYNPIKVRFDEAYFYDDDNDLEALAQFLFSEEEAVVITTSLKSESAIPAVAEFLEFVSDHIPNIPAFVIACENGFSSSRIKRSYQGADNFIFIDSVVDRICREITLQSGRDSHPFVNVSTEFFKRFVVDDVVGASILYDRMRVLDGVVVTKYIEIYKKQKLNILNAAHILLAGDAQTFEMPLINRFLQDENIGTVDAPSLSERRQHVKEVLKELSSGVQAMVAEEFGGDIDPDASSTLQRLTSEDSLDEIIERFTSVPDDVSRILSRLKTPSAQELHTMSDFLRSMMPKIKPPVLAFLNDNNFGPPRVTRSFLRISDLIADRRFVTPVVIH